MAVLTTQLRNTAERFQRQQHLTAQAAVSAAATRWNQIDPDDIMGSWEELLPAATGTTTAGQLRAAEAGAAYVPAAVRAQGGAPNPAGHVQPSAFAGFASDGRPLDTLMAFPAAQTVGRVGRGTPPREALAQGRGMLSALVATQVMDSARNASSVGMVADRTVNRYARMISPPACARCAILAGKLYRLEEAFLRHPHCECVHVPASQASSGLESNPQDYFDSLDEAEQDRVFTNSGAQAIRDGADMNQVVNARRNMRTTSAYGKQISTTLMGTTARGSAGRIMEKELGAQFGRERQRNKRRRINVPRLMPEQIYADARNRDEAIRLLGRFGYLGGDAPRMTPTRII